MIPTNFIEIEGKFKDLFKSGMNYVVQDGIIDFVNTEEPLMPDNYGDILEKRYNRWVKSRFMMKLVWGVDLDSLPKIDQYIKNYPEGIILDCPVGTGVFSSEIYKALPEREFIAADYSLNMLKIGKRYCERLGIRNVCFIRADVGSLPFRDKVFSGVVSLNGFHAFTSPHQAASEFHRVTKEKGGLMMVVSCGKERFISDLFIKHMMIPKGYFANFLSSKEYSYILKESGYQEVNYQMMGASMISCSIA
ncbi:MAG: methyltransferase domain-containing protein [Deltaproteobacteria bacterium]|nr:methyltransferase domain-containing protein [Deltaproteobacteria bacterium]